MITKEKQIILLTATYVIEDGVYVGWINEERSCISQSDTLKELIESLKTVYWVKHCHEHNKNKTK